MDIYGKKINFLGDSITEGCCTSGYPNRFTDILEKKYNLAAARNYGIGGTRYAHQSLPSQDEKLDGAYCYRIEMINPDADIVVIFGGTNDFGHGNAPFGVDSDRTSATFIGACHRLFTRARERFPKATIVVVTPTHRPEEKSHNGDGRFTDGSGYNLDEYTAKIRELAKEYGFPILDLYARSDFDSNNQELNKKFFADGLHPNDTGHVYLAKAIGDFLEKL